MKVELSGISKRFGPVQANRRISLEVPAGCIQGILGENGAGKSTLMKILSGCLRPDAGEIRLDGVRVGLASPAEAIRQGVGMLHQDPLDFPPMQVIDNFMAGHGGAFFKSRHRTIEAFSALQEPFGFTLDPSALTGSLTVGERQQLEILRLLDLQARVLILDEPTTGISAPQKRMLFDSLRRLAERGHTIFFVTHKLEDVQTLCHQVAVLRQGRLAGEVRPPFRMDALVEMMFGRLITPPAAPSAARDGAVLDLRALELEEGRIRLEGVSLQVRPGEIIGLAGLEGSGQDLLLRVCAGLHPPSGGRLFLQGLEFTRRPYPAFRHSGVAYVPSARLELGLLPNLNLMDHLLLARRTGGLLIDWGWARTEAAARIADFCIQGTPHTPVRSLSGGNQQRALLSLLPARLALLLMEHPTRGLDVESASAVWQKLRQRCQDGTAILFTSIDLEEILGHSDRILVFADGTISPPLPVESCTPERLGHLIGGRSWAGHSSGGPLPC